MTTQIFPRYIHNMYYYLAMCDDELDEFHINEEPCRAKHVRCNEGGLR